MKTRYYNRRKDQTLLSKLKKTYPSVHCDSPLILLFENEDILGYLTLDLMSATIIDGACTSKEGTTLLLKKAMMVLRLESPHLLLPSLVSGQLNLSHDAFGCITNEQGYVLSNLYKDANRIIKIGFGTPGPQNTITDVNGVLVGHTTFHTDVHHTGVTAILPHGGNLFQEKVVANSTVYNGFGKSMGLVQIEELGTIETPILLTNTLAIGQVSDALIRYTLDHNEDIGVTTGSLNPVVLECNDSTLNDIRNQVITKDDVYQAINTASKTFAQGSVGAGSGMTTLGFKGGIGSSSRVFDIQGASYTIGVLVNSNFQGSSPRHLLVQGRAIGEQIQTISEEKPDLGSIIIVVATDAPLDARQMKRVAKRAILGIGKIGGYAGNGSGDIVVAFSTANRVNHYATDVENILRLPDASIDPIFEATVEATEEAILNSLLYSKRTLGVRGNVSKSILEFQELFDDLYVL